MAVNMDITAAKLANSKRLDDRVSTSKNVKASNGDTTIKSNEENPKKYDTFDYAASKTKGDVRLTDMLKNRTVDVFDNKLMVEGVEYNFAKGSAGDYIKNSLSDKVKNSSLIADELVTNLQGTFYNKNASIDDRAINREVAIKNAEHIAKNCFDDEDEADAFMSEIKRFAENDIWREKGYVVDDSSPDTAPQPYYVNPADSKNSDSIKQYLKDKNVDFSAMSQDERNSFLKGLGEDFNKWSSETKASFNNNSAKAESIINTIKNSFDNGNFKDLIEKSILRLSKVL